MPQRDYPRIVVTPPGPKGKAIVAKDQEWTSTSYIKEYPLVIAGGKGAMVEDVDGNRFIDFMAGIAVSSTGYNHPKVVGAIKDAAERFLHICGTDFYFEGFANLAERLAKLAPGKSKKRVFLSNSGTEAVEAAIKLARNHTRRSGLIAFQQSFHGRTYGAMSLTSSKVKQHAHFGPLLPEVYHVPFANPYKYGGDAASVAYSIGAIEDLFARQIHPEDIAGIFLEPIQGEGGYVIPPQGYLKALRELCDKHGIMLVFDEVQSGVGRTGKWWAADWEGVEPDILITAKGLASGMPIGAMIAKESIMTWESGAHGSTFGGNPVTCAAGVAALRALADPTLLEHVRAVGDHFRTRLEGLGRCGGIRNVRGMGLMLGVELDGPGAAVVSRCLAAGLLINCTADRILRFLPPLVITRAQVDEGFAILERALAA